MNTETLLAPVSEASPCGENLEYDADFLAMEQASHGKAEQQFGDTIIPAAPADWNKVEKLASELLSRTKDLRVLLALTRARTHLQGLAGYASGLALINQALQRYWDDLYPALWYDGEADPFFRINALAALGDTSTLSTAVRQAVLIRNAAETITLRDAAALLDGSKTDCPGYPGGRARLTAGLAQSRSPEVAAVAAIIAELERLQEILAHHLSGSGVPEMRQLMRSLRLVAQFSSTEAEPATPLPTPLVQVEARSAPGAPAAIVADATEPQLSQDWRSVSLASRQDAQLMLEKVKQYFIRHEPSHPAPLMIDRLLRTIDLDFMAIVRDLAPDCVQQLETILGRQER
ncbi:type VI secretion system protein TssA [Kalamiella sp. sgz302252]|uniref:type VI secretion system protein TssA n=1 Tax=Pantoea sp. sgz302252 TaxID=3341827 RepID=UPI0036D247CA